MFFNHINKHKKMNNNGFTLVEILIVLIILGILFSISISSFSPLLKRTNLQIQEIQDKIDLVFGNDYDVSSLICKENCIEVQILYESYLSRNNLQHDPILFLEFFYTIEENVCPKNGSITYSEGLVLCSIHPRKLDDDDTVNDDDDEDDDGGVPFL